MKTLLYREIDGHQIVSGCSEPTVDGVETDKIVMGYKDDKGVFQPGLLQATPEHQAVEAKKAEFRAAAEKRSTAIKTKDNAKFKEAVKEMQTLQEDAIPLAKAVHDRIIALRRDNAVYFEPKAGEVITPAETADARIQAIKNKPDGVFIALDGSEVPDNRGQVYFMQVAGKWQKTEIKKLGDTVPAGAVAAEDVTDEQRSAIERDLVAALPAETRELYKDKALAVALKTAKDMRSELEIQGDPDALQKSKDAYDTEVARITALYG
jgi:hypothetical protein